MIVRNFGRKCLVGLVAVIITAGGFACTNSDSRKPVPGRVNLTKTQQRTAFWLTKYLGEIYFSEEDGINKKSGQRMFSQTDIQNVVNQILKTNLTHDDVMQNLDQHIEDLNKNDPELKRATFDIRERIAELIREASKSSEEEPKEAE